MRVRYIPALLTVVAVAVGCPKPQPAVHELVKTNDVKISADCLNGGGISWTIDPYRATIPDRDRKIKWRLTTDGHNADPLTEVTILPKVNSTWAFAEQDIKVNKNNITEKNLKTGLKTDYLYKYTIQIICTRGTTTQVDTVVIDPDMIIPTGGRSAPEVQ